MSTSVKMIAIPLPVVPAARSTIAPPTEPRPDLPPPFKPRSVSVSREDLLRAIDIEPFALLPRTFIPIPSANYQPPVMHYGWPAPRQTLLTYAKKHGLILMMRRRNRTLPGESDGESSDDDASESSTDDGTEDIENGNVDSSSKGGNESDGSATAAVERTSKTLKLLPPLFTKGTRTDVDGPATMVAALKHIFTRLTTKDRLRLPPTMNLFLTLQHGGGERQLISVYTNYHFLRKDLPSPEDIQKFGEAVGITIPPKWYIDHDKYEWRSISWDPYER